MARSAIGVWDTNGGAVGSVRAPAPVRAPTVTSSGTVISGDAEGRLRTWNLSN
ncbi:hypothetical protein ACQPXH_14475 [Nocardia sp. CA-135953]|uniref:hypothetical protein n=1 Tax=Nocardia sp. CA-135953 TaxID=3239978 RepID=UPI003D991101